MKIFVWDDPWRVTYGGSFIAVGAETIEQAREILTQRGYSDYDVNDYRHFLNREPSEIVSVPGFFVREWSE